MKWIFFPLFYLIFSNCLFYFNKHSHSIFRIKSKSPKHEKKCPWIRVFKWSSSNKKYISTYHAQLCFVHWRRKRKRGWVKQFSTPSASWPRRSKYIRGSMKQLSTLYSVRKVQVAPARKSRSMLARHFNRNASLTSTAASRRKARGARCAPHPITYAHFALHCAIGAQQQLCARVRMCFRRSW